MRTNGIVLTTQLCAWTIQKSVNGEWRDAILHQQRVSALMQPRSLGTWLLTGGGSTGKRHYPGVDFDRIVNDENYYESVIERSYGGWFPGSDRVNRPFSTCGY